MNTAGNTWVGMAVDNLPGVFPAEGYDIYIGTHYANVFAWGRYMFELDLGEDGTLDNTLYSMHAPPSGWTDDWQFVNPSMSTTLPAPDAPHSTYVVFRDVGKGVDSFSVTASNLDGRKANINAFQVVAVPEPCGLVALASGALLLVCRRAVSPR